MKQLKNTIVCIILGCLTSICEAQSLKVLTYNIRLDIASDGVNAWSNRKDYFNAQLQFYNPDIFGIQEALPNQVRDIAAAHETYKNISMGRDGMEQGEASSLFFKKDRFTLLQGATFWLSETPNIISKGWDAALNRICTYALLKDKETKKHLWVFNTHLDHRGERARTESLALIVTKIKQLNTQNYPVILMGDFNSEPQEESIKQLKKSMDDSRDISIQKPFGPNGTFNGFKHNETVTKIIDYIFLSKNNPFLVTKYAILSDSKDLKYPSDHLPVYIELKLK